MDEILVSLVRGGSVVETIRRPLRWVDGKPAITYRRTLWPVHDGVVYLDGSAPTIPNPDEDPTAVHRSVGVESHEPAPTLAGGWDPSQHSVIFAPASARLLVDAGPGTGKTAVACARIASLIEKALAEPVNCLIVSFTQTAVYELRSRIGSYLSQPSDAAGIRIVTLDAYAWSLRSGFDESATLTGSYEHGVAAALKIIASNPDAAEYLERAEHVIIDEAQDIVGIRADFVFELIGKLNPECGITVFADEAQAIYGFADDSISHGSSEPRVADSLPRRLRLAGGFSNVTLEKVHRTESPVLCEIFTKVRGMVLDHSVAVAPSTRGNRVRAAVERLTGDQGLQARTLDSSILTDTSLVLFRRRAEALQASAMMQAIPHRLRLGGLPVCLQPWVGACFFDFTAPRISRLEFVALWAERVDGVLPRSGDHAWAWERLVAIAGSAGGSVDLRALRRVLGRRHPPPDLCYADFGPAGPVLGTIHGSKGREADNVLLFLPEPNGTDTDYDEETRILFVGATRARTQLRTGSGYQMKTGNLVASKRTFSYLNRSKEHALMTEIGREGDLRASGLTGRAYFDQTEAAWAQRRCLALAAEPAVACASLKTNMQHAYAIAVDGEPPVAVLSKAFRDDLWELAKVSAGKRALHLCPPINIHHVRLAGVRTVVLPLDDVECEHLHEPWASSGFMVAPNVIAYTKIRFWNKK